MPAAVAMATAHGVVGWPLLADAHAGGTAFIQLLPTHLYIAGAAIAVAVSFLLTAVVPVSRVAQAAALRLRLGAIRVPGRDRLATATSLASLLILTALVIAGVVGSRDPLSNPLPLFVWAVWWIGFTYLHAVLGDVWSVVNPWRGLHALLTTAGPLRGWRDRPPVAYPLGAGCWPAVAGFAAFAWFELIYPAPMDPAILAGVVSGYVVAHLIGTLVFGLEWLARAETFSVFFRIVSWVAPVCGRRPASPGSDEPRTLELTPPTFRLLTMPSLGASAVVFVVLVLSAVSFDGFSRTFTWLGLIGVNPLAYPGRTALMLPNTLGLAGTFAALSLAYVGAVTLGARAGVGAPPGPLLGVFALALVPIVCGYHFAHYLPVFLVDVQYALRAASDPFARGWDLFGTRQLPVVTSFLSDASRVYAIWHAQVALIVGAHVAGVVVAHGRAVRDGAVAPAALLGQLPLLSLMIAYTVLGLWLLSTPAVG